MDLPSVQSRSTWAPGLATWLALAGSICPRLAQPGCPVSPGWLDLAALVAPGRPGCLNLAVSGVLTGLGCLDLAALGALPRPDLLNLAGLNSSARPALLDPAANESPNA